MKTAPLEFCWKACASDGRCAGAVAAVDEGDRIQCRGLTRPASRWRACRSAHLDRIGAQGIDLAGACVHIDKGIGAGSGGSIELVHQDQRWRCPGRNRRSRSRSHQRHPGSSPGWRPRSWATGGQTRLGIGAAAVSRRAANADGAVIHGIGQAVEGVEVVEQVHAHHLQRAAHNRRSGSARVSRLEIDIAVQRVDRAHPVGVAAGAVACPGVVQHAHDARGGVAAAQRVAGRKRQTTAAEQDRVGVLDCERRPG